MVTRQSQISMHMSPIFVSRTLFHITTVSTGASLCKEFLTYLGYISKEKYSLENFVPGCSCIYFIWSNLYNNKQHLKSKCVCVFVFGLAVANLQQSNITGDNF